MFNVQAPAPIVTRPARGAAFLLLGIALAACAPKDERPAPSAPAAAAATAAARPTPEITYPPMETPDLSEADARILARAVFKDGVEHGGEEDGDGGFTMLHRDAQRGYQQMRLVAAKELADGRTAVIFNGKPSDAKGADQSEFSEPGTVNLYLLRRAGGGWIVTKRREGLAELGTNGHFGYVKWARIGRAREGFIVYTSMPSRGESEATGTAELFDLGTAVRHLGGIAHFLDESASCYPASGACTDAEGALRFVDATDSHGYHDILVDFKGKRYTVTEDENGSMNPHVSAQLRQTARYRFDGKRYVLAAGANPAQKTQ